MLQVWLIYGLVGVLLTMIVDCVSVQEGADNFTAMEILLSTLMWPVLLIAVIVLTIVEYKKYKNDERDDNDGPTPSPGY